MSQAIRAILFDLDGTLLDSLADIAGAMNDVLRAAGYPEHGTSAYREFIGSGAEVLVRRAAPEHADTGELLSRFRAHYGAHCMDSTRPFPGVPELLADLRARGLPLAVLSNKPEAAAIAMVAASFVPGTFSAVVGDRPGVQRKPDPTAALGIARTLAVAAAGCALVGDTEIDVRTAKAAGMRAIAVTWGMREAHELQATAPDAIAADLAELRALLLPP